MLKTCIKNQKNSHPTHPLATALSPLLYLPLTPPPTPVWISSQIHLQNISASQLPSDLFSFLLGKFLRVELVGHMVGVYLTLLQNS